MRPLSLVFATALALLAVAFAAPLAGATTVSGSGTDPTGDSTVGPTQDLTDVSATYDDAGSVTATVTLAADPASAPNFVFVLVGTRTASGTCGTPGVVLGAYSDQAQGVWGLDSDPSSSYQAAAVTTAGPRITISASSSRLAGGALSCVTATVSPQGSGQPASDRLDAPAALTAPATTTPPPTTTAPAPAPTPTTPAPAPTPAPASVGQSTAAASAPVRKTARLAVTVSGVPATIRRARWMALRVKVANTGTAAARSVRLRVGTARGLSVRPKAITLKTLKAGGATTRTVRLALTRRARQTTTVLFTASGAGRVVARGRLALTLGRARAIRSPAPGGGRTPARPSSPLAGTYWWYTINQVTLSWDNHGVYFLDDHWAYRGIPKGGLPASCTAQTAGTNDRGEETDGCIPYTYDPATGALTLGTAAGSFRDGRLQITDEGDVRDYQRLVVPDAGARYTTNLTHRWFQGMCGFFTGCTTGQDSLQLLPDGQFIKNGSTISTMGDPGGTFTYAGSYPADQHGVYEVQPGGRIHLAFADGTAKDYTFAIQTTAAGQPDPVNEGVMLDEDNFYREDDA